MDSLNGRVLELLRGSRDWPTQEFQHNALAVLREVCSFDMAKWGVGAFEEGVGQKYESISLHGIPSEVYQDIDKIAHCDGASDEVSRRNGRNIDAVNLGTRFKSPHYSDYRRYLKRYSFNHMLYAVVPRPGSNYLNFIAFLRNGERKAFSRGEVATIRLLMLCAIEAGVTNHQFSIGRSHTGNGLGARSFHAIATTTGVVMSSDPGFHDLIGLEWQRHRAPFLPQDLLRALQGLPGQRYMSKRLMVSASFHGGVMQLCARKNQALSRVTPAELEVVRLIAKGCSNKEAAEQLRLSIATVRNHLTAVYSKLDFTGSSVAVRQRAISQSGARNRENWKKSSLIRWWLEEGY
jgi:DNA-binding CsgD family transcriptional regulator